MLAYQPLDSAKFIRNGSGQQNDQWLTLTVCFAGDSGLLSCELLMTASGELMMKRLSVFYCLSMLASKHFSTDALRGGERPMDRRGLNT